MAMDSVTVHKDLFVWCQILFPQCTGLSMDFIRYLRPEGVKTAYRSLVMDNHPDKARQNGASEKVLEVRFRQITEAYQSLLHFIENPRLIPNQETGNSRNSAVRPPARSQHEARTVPHIRLRLAEFLYYTGVIPWKSIGESIRWQRSKRRLAGQLAVEWKFLLPRQVADVLRQGRPGELFGETARRINYLTEYQLMVILGSQALSGVKIGRYFLEQGLVDQSQLSKLVNELRRHNFLVSRHTEGAGAR